MPFLNPQRGVILAEGWRTAKCSLLRSAPLSLEVRSNGVPHVVHHFRDLARTDRTITPWEPLSEVVRKSRSEGGGNRLG
jgi:hypothetical protein